MTLAEKFAQAIAQQQAEVDRLAKVATVDLPVAKARLDQLRTVAGKVTPAMETTLAALKGFQIKLDE